MHKLCECLQDSALSAKAKTKCLCISHTTLYLIAHVICFSALATWDFKQPLISAEISAFSSVVSLCESRQRNSQQTSVICDPVWVTLDLFGPIYSCCCFLVQATLKSTMSVQVFRLPLNRAESFISDLPTLFLKIYFSYSLTLL